MAKLTLSLSDVLSFAKSNNMDTSDLEACKEAYRSHLEALKSPDKAATSSQTKRAYNQLTVSLCIMIPPSKKGQVHTILTFQGLAQKRAQLMTLAYTEARKVISKESELKNIQVFWGEEFNLMMEIENTKA